MGLSNLNPANRNMRTLGCLVLLLSVFVLGSCAQTRTVKVKVYQDRRTGVALRSVVGRDAVPFVKGYSHPVEFKLDDLKYLLRSISYQTKGLFGWSQVRNVFSADELYRLAPHLIEAFAQATPDQEVVFHLTSSEKGASFWSERFTSGSMFVKDKKLDVLFANVDVNPESSEIYDGDPRNYYAGVLWRLVKADYQSLAQGEKEIHYNWVEMDFEPQLAEKRQAEEALVKKRERARAARRRIIQEQTGWEDWEPGEVVDSGLPEDENLAPTPEAP